MNNSELFDTGLTKAIENVRQSITPYGFTASATDYHNYQRVWSRDGVIVSLAMLLLEEEEFTNAALATLRTLMQHQGPHGEIPSNVDISKGHVSYGGTAGRVDANLWFLIGCHQYWKATQDERFLEEFLPSIQKIEFLLGAWEFNTKDLLYIPETGDWADEYLQHGYVLYDQLLYWRALKGVCDIYRVTGERNIDLLNQKINRIVSLIRANYWFNHTCDPYETDAYHPIIFEKGCAAARDRDTYWMPYFSPTGYGYRFDAMANVLASLLDVSNERQRDKTDTYIEEKIVPREMKLLPAFSPVIEEIDEDWKELQSTFSYTFKNHPYEFHNGGLWPLITGFYVVDLARRGEEKKAKEYLAAIHKANSLDKDGGEWGFYEYVNGKTFEPGGTRYQTWSASSAVIGHMALKGKTPL